MPVNARGPPLVRTGSADSFRLVLGAQDGETDSDVGMQRAGPRVVRPAAAAPELVDARIHVDRVRAEVRAAVAERSEVTQLEARDGIDFVHVDREAEERLFVSRLEVVVEQA